VILFLYDTLRLHDKTRSMAPTTDAICNFKIADALWHILGLSSLCDLMILTS